MAASTVLRSARQILKFLSEGQGYERVMKGVEVVSALPGKCTCEVTLAESHLNRVGALHGGFTATMVDIVSTLAIMTAEKPPGVSVDMNITYMNSAHLGDTLLVEAECLKIGKTLVFASVDIQKTDGTVVAQGRHTKHLGSAPSSTS